MDAGNISNPTPNPDPSFYRPQAGAPPVTGVPLAPQAIGAPQSIASAEINPLDHMHDHVIEDAVTSDRNKSRLAALGIAALVHGVLFVLLGWMVVSFLKPEEVELVLEAGNSSKTTAPQKESFAKRVTQDKPSPPSRMATKTISASNVASAVVMPAVEEVNDLPAFGSEFGDGFGMGGFGDGRGGSSFFGTSGGGNRIILVIDTSTSMNGNCGANGIKALRREIKRTISALAPETRFNIIWFGNDADGFAGQPTAASGSAKSGALRWMEDYFVNRDFTRTRTSKWGNKGRDGKGIAYTAIAPNSIGSLKGTSGGSRMDLALVAAFKQKPSTVFLIADGEPGTRRGNQAMSKKAIVDLIESEAKQIYGSSPKPKVNCISVKGIGEAVLKDIASRFKGKYKAIDPNKI